MDILVTIPRAPTWASRAHPCAMGGPQAADILIPKTRVWEPSLFIQRTHKYYHILYRHWRKWKKCHNCTFLPLLCLFLSSIKSLLLLYIYCLFPVVCACVCGAGMGGRQRTPVPQWSFRGPHPACFHNALSSPFSFASWECLSIWPSLPLIWFLHFQVYYLLHLVQIVTQLRYFLFTRVSSHELPLFNRRCILLYLI